MSENDTDDGVRDEARVYLLSCEGDDEPLDEDD